MPTDRLTREEVERLLAARAEPRHAVDMQALHDPVAALARTCLVLMDERDNAAVAVARAEETASLYAADREALWRVVKRACEALRVTVDDEDDWPRLPHEAAAAAARIARLEATLAVERGEHVAGVTDGWEWDAEKRQWGLTIDDDTGAVVHRIAAGRWAWLIGCSAMWMIAAGEADTALEAIEAANAARAAEEASCPK